MLWEKARLVYAFCKRADCLVAKLTSGSVLRIRFLGFFLLDRAQFKFGKVVSEHCFGRVSADMSTDISADTRSTYRPRVSTDTRSTEAFITHDPTGWLYQWWKTTYILFFILLVSSFKWRSKEHVRKFKSKQKKRDVHNKYNDHYSQLEPAKKKQCYSSMDWAKKDTLLETLAKNKKKWMHQKRNNFLKIKENNINRWTFHKKKNNNLLDKIAEQSRKRHHSMDCKKKEKHLNTKRNQ